VAPAGAIVNVEVVIDPVTDTAGRGRYRARVNVEVLAEFAALARCSKALAKLIAAWRSPSFCISTSDVIGSPRREQIHLMIQRETITAAKQHKKLLLVFCNCASAL
jgi:hypothetical protein